MGVGSFSLLILLLSASSICLSLQSGAAAPPFSCDSSNPSTRSLPFCNAGLPIDARVNDLVPRLTLDEKIQQLVNTAAAVPRLNISAYEWWSEALHGVSRHGRGVNFNGSIKAATMFPQIILSAASFDSRLWYRIAQAIGRETRAVFNAGQGKGMTYWAPNINIFRDPRWGRGQETAGEDPTVAAQYAVAYVRGLQGDSFDGGEIEPDGTNLMASACCKHYTAHDLDNWHGITRYTFDAKVSKQDLADSFQPPFKACVEQGKASGMMCSYNRVNGVPTCADYNLLTSIARQQWGFQGYIASDCDAVAIIHDVQGYAKEPEDAVADVLKAGMDVNCGNYLAKFTKSAVAKNKVSEADVDRALHNLFSIRMRLGNFNGDPRKLKYGDITEKQVCSKEHLDLALEAARSGIVLLKNELGLLPLNKNTESLAVIGPNANTSTILVGNYEGHPCKNITILQALQNQYGISTRYEYHQGCNFANCTSASIDEAVDIAKEADYVVLVTGLDQTLEREKLDRVDLGLPGHQEDLITAVATAANRPVVLVLLNGGPLDVSFAKTNPKIGSILWAGYPGEAGGVAVAETLFGDNNPGGKLPVTWYPKDFTKTAMTDMRMRPDPSEGYPGRTYRFYTGPTVYEFGYGLSYTTYTYKFTKVSHEHLFLNSSSSRSCSNSVLVSELGAMHCKRMKFSAQVRVTNDGGMAGKHPVILFARSNNTGSGAPARQLVGFKTVRLSPGQSKVIQFAIDPCEHFTHADEDGLMVIEEGTIELVTGDEKYPINVLL